MNDAEELVGQVRSLSSRVSTFVRRNIAEHDAFAQNAISLSRRIGECRSKYLSSGDRSALDHIEQAKIHFNGNGPGGDLRKLKTKRNPWLLSFLLGQKCTVMTLRTDMGLAMKEDYQLFRSRIGMGIAGVPLLLLYGLHRADQSDALSFRPMIMFGIQLYVTWLCYVYIALALRENVLYVNGSHIRSWWIAHHYLSLLTCVMLLSCPVDSPSFEVFCRKFLRWSVLQGVVMLVQNRYQRRRMYTRIALGKNSAMDVVTAESSGMQGQLILLYPLLFILQIWQFLIGGEIVYTMSPALLSSEDWLDPAAKELDLRGRRGVLVAGGLLLVMAVCNFYYTVASIVDKRARKSRTH